MSDKSKTKWAWLIGFGMAISGIHNLWLTNITSINGQATLFLPAIGTGIWIMGALIFITYNYQHIKWGNLYVEIPLILIALSMGITGFLTDGTFQDKMSPLFMGISLIGVYAVGKTIGVELFKAFVPFVVLGSVISIILGIVNPGQYQGGMITNYCASAGFLIFGAVVSRFKWQWALILIALIGVFYIGALESVFILGILFIALIIRKDWNKKLLIIGIPLVILLGLWAVLGYLIPLYEGNLNLVYLWEIVTGKLPLDFQAMQDLTSGRWNPIVEALNDIRLFGHGYSLSTVQGGIVHNIPLIILHQIGIIPAIAWTFVTIYCLFKTKWKYAWIAVIAMSVFDHYLYTQFVPFVFALAGVSIASTIDNDYIFRGKNEHLSIK